LLEAIKECDEVVLSERVDQARCLGSEFRWQDELDNAESVLYEIACSDTQFV